MPKQWRSQPQPLGVVASLPTPYHPGSCENPHFQSPWSLNCPQSFQRGLSAQLVSRPGCLRWLRDQLKGVFTCTDSRMGGPDDLDMVPEIILDVEEAFTDPDTLSVGGECITGSPYNLTLTLDLELAESAEISALLNEVPSSQPRKSLVSERDDSPPLLTPANFQVAAEQPPPVCLPALPQPFYQEHPLLYHPPWDCVCVPHRGRYRQ